MDAETQLFDDDSKDRQFVNALARGLELLRCFRPGEAELGNAELARRTGMPKPTVSRLTYTLTKLGYLAFSETRGTYRLAPGVLALGYAMLSNLDVRKVARPYMEELSEYAQASVSIATRDRLGMVYIESVRSSANVALRLDVGSRIPLATSAAGRALLAGLPRGERDYLMDHIRLRDEDNWPRVKAGIEQALRDYEERGFVISAGDWQADVHAIGVPLVGVDGERPMAFNCGGPAFLLPLDRLVNDIGPRLIQLVRKVEIELGRSLPTVT